jgi:tetratricopeptide (TPR) repeat protein
MKLLFLSAAALSLVFTGLMGLNSATHAPTVASMRGFEEPLVPLGGGADANTDSALIDAIKAHKARKSYEDVSALEAYVNANANSPWTFSLLANLGDIYRKTGHFSKAVDAWEQAWALGKGEKKDEKVQALANQTAANLATLLSSLGRTERLESLLKEVKGRTLYGSASTMLMIANENLYLMKNRPGTSFKCGPYALDSILTFTDKKNAHPALIRKAQSSTKGFSLVQVRDLSKQLNMNYQMAKSGSPEPTLSFHRWRTGRADTTRRCSRNRAIFI